MMVEYFMARLNEAPDCDAVVSADFRISFGDLALLVERYSAWLQQQAVPQGAVVSFSGDYSPAAVALTLALAKNGNVLVPLSQDSRHQFNTFREIAQTEFDIQTEGQELVVKVTGRKADHPLYQQLRQQNHPGLVLFSSGSTGKSKGIVQNLEKLMQKFRQPRKALRMLIFLQLDHIGGFNSLLYALANSGTIIVSDARTPDKVCRAIERFRAQVLPTSPTFLNLLLLSRAYENYDLSSLQLITYGTEPMQASTLAGIRQVLPKVALQQTYGLSEVGILRSKSRSDDSLWIKVGGDEFDVKIVEGTLRIRAQSSMLGYLNAPSPFDEDGYLDTGDMVEQDGDWIRILGRASEIINVGGQKVFPAEVESVLLEIPEVEDVVVYGADHPITGKIVCAKFRLNLEESNRDLKARMLKHCKGRLASYKIPSKVIITQEATHNERYKRMRREHVQ